ncbi:MAG: flippase [Candidatus Micrarchaeota archaeon]|nr:flippase [Candidatus Micrarchaeota archaeon]
MKTSVSKGTFYLLVAQAIFLGVGYAVHIALGRLMGPELYGVFGVVLGLMSIVMLIPSSGVPIAVSKFISCNEKSAGSILKESLKIQLILCTVIFLIYFSSAGLIATALSDERFILYVRLTSVSIFLVGISSVYSGYLNGVRHFGKQSLVSIAHSLTKLTAILLVVMGLGVLGAVFGYLLSYLAALLLALWFSRLVTGDGKFEWRKILYFSMPVIAYSVFSNLLPNIDILMIKSLLRNDSLVGYYNSASTIGRLFYFLVGTLFATLIPAISVSIAAGNQKKANRYVTSSIRYSLMLLIPISLVVSATASDLASFVYSSAFAQAGEPLSIFIFGISFFTLLSGLASMLIAAGKPKHCMLILGLVCLLSLALNFLLIPVMGIKGAALASTISSFVGLVVAYYYVTGEFGCLISMKSLARISLASLLIYLPSLYIVLPNKWLLPLEYAFLFGFYFVVLIVIKEWRKEDFEIIKKLVPKRFSTGIL